MKFPFSTNSLARQVAVRSAVNPSLWACVVVSLPLFYYAHNSTGNLSVSFFVIGAVPIALFSVSYLFLLFTNPSYLRSEEYQLKIESLKYFGDKDNHLQANADDVIELVNNPKLPPPNTAGQLE